MFLNNLRKKKRVLHNFRNLAGIIKGLNSFREYSVYKYERYTNWVKI